MAELTVQNIAQGGLEATFAAATDTTGDIFINDDRTFLWIKNGDSGDIVASIAAVKASSKVDGLGTITHAALEVTVTAGEERLIKVPAGIYNNTAGKATVICDSVTSITLAAIRMPAG